MNAVSPAGELNIRLHMQGNTIARVEIQSSRPKAAGRLFEGRPVFEVVRLLPHLFSLCGLSQQIAALTAAEQAMGYTPSAALLRSRRQLLLAEQGREQLLRLWRDWLDMAAELQPIFSCYTLWLAAIQKQLACALELAPLTYNAAEPAPLPPLLPEVSVNERIARLALARPDDLIDQALLTLQQSLGHLALGAAPSQLQVLPADELLRVLTPAFSEQPQWQAQCCHTDSISNYLPATQALHPLVARLLGLVSSLQSLDIELQQAQWTLPEVELPAGVGLAQVPSARGLLIHKLTLQGSEVADYQMVAPTEWNFHPCGVLPQMLTGVSVASHAQAQQLAHRLTLLIDPCVGFNVEVIEDA